jgi:queuine/archaeosine tRNA-ribosyltransferase
MTIARTSTICLKGVTVPLPCYFPSVSSVKTNLRPVDYVEVLAAAQHPLFLVSAYDIAAGPTDHQVRMRASIEKSRANGTVVLMDSSNYEGFWKADSAWTADIYHEVTTAFDHDIGFCYDNHQPGNTASEISSEVTNSVLRDQAHSQGTIVPIIHGATDLLPAAVQQVAEQLCPVMLAVPERALGDGVIARACTVRRIREALDATGVYYPLHLLGTGNPLSIAAYSMAGADSFDGLEWCQTVVDHDTGLLSHFQHWDFVRNQTDWGANNLLPYIQSVLLHNLEFYSRFMRTLHECPDLNAVTTKIPCLSERHIDAVRRELNKPGGC